MVALAVQIFHWTCAVLSVPFAVLAFFASNPEKVAFVKDKVALPLPPRVLGFCSQFAHLTIVSHELTAGYFVWAILLDRGVVEAHVDADGDSWMEVYLTVALAVGLFVAFVFWGSALIDPFLMAPLDQMFPESLKLTPTFKRHLIFGAMFGPTDTMPDCAWQTHFRLFMQYLHTLCPLLLVVELMFVDHRPSHAALEMSATGTFAICYIGWNMFCWWLLRTAPYPLQKRFYELGLSWAIFAYTVLTIFVMMLCAYTRWMRLERSWLSIGLPIAAVLWATSGLAPFRGAVARKQGLDPELLFKGWKSGGVSPFSTKEAEDAYRASHGDPSKQG